MFRNAEGAVVVMGNIKRYMIVDFGGATDCEHSLLSSEKRGAMGRTISEHVRVIVCVTREVGLATPRVALKMS